MKDFDYVKINSVNSLYLIIGKASTDKNKTVLIKCTKLWDRIKNLIEEIND